MALFPSSSRAPSHTAKMEFYVTLCNNDNSTWLEFETNLKNHWADSKHRHTSNQQQKRDLTLTL